MKATKHETGTTVLTVIEYRRNDCSNMEIKARRYIYGETRQYDALEELTRNGRIGMGTTDIDGHFRWGGNRFTHGQEFLRDIRRRPSSLPDNESQYPDNHNRRMRRIRDSMFTPLPYSLTYVS